MPTLRRLVLSSFLFPFEKGPVAIDQPIYFYRAGLEANRPGYSSLTLQLDFHVHAAGRSSFISASTVLSWGR